MSKSSFIAGGLKHNQQEFHEAISENGSGLMLVAASKLISASYRILRYANTP